MTQEIHALRREIDHRFQGLEKLLERVTIAVEKQADNRERLIAQETRLGILEERHGEHNDWLKSIERRHVELAKQVVRLAAYATVGGAVAGAIVGVIAKNLIGG